MKKQSKSISPQDKVLKEMKKWQMNNCCMLDDYDTLWKMFRAVVTSSCYGTSEFGGPVWLLDFSLANLKKLFPDNPWLEAMEKEWEKGKYGYGNIPKSEQLIKFSEWFEYRSEHFVNWLGLGNVIVKQETGYQGNISLYGLGLFLDVVQSLTDGKVFRPSTESMIKWNFSLQESDAVRRGNFLTRLISGDMVKKFPIFMGGIRPCRSDNIHGECYRLEHFSLTKGFVIPETQQEKFLMLIVNDLMECKAQGYGNKADRDGNVVPYPKMKFEQYLDCAHYGCGHHFRQTDETFRWERSDGDCEKITINLPKIDSQYGEFWHRQFPPKQNWRELDE